ncbi:sporulation peptidase YabG [Clostridiaceae bacterium 35-E11]
MGKVKIGDFVARKSYGYDVLFKVVGFMESPNREKVVILKGVNLRILADSPEIDLYRIPLNKVDDFDKSFDKKINKVIKKIMKKRNERTKRHALLRSLSDPVKEAVPFGKSGSVLHLDGDQEYLDICAKTYKQLEMNVVGKQVKEKEQPKVVQELLMEYRPDILVITGHDGLLKDYHDFENIAHYRNSSYFVEAVKEARKYEPNMDDLVVFAGACQSHYEAILEAGANFASSPHRVLMKCRI